MSVKTAHQGSNPAFAGQYSTRKRGLFSNPLASGASQTELPNPQKSFNLPAAKECGSFWDLVSWDTTYGVVDEMVLHSRSDWALLRS